MLKGNFIQPIIFKKYVKGERDFNIDKFYNIRKTTFVKKFKNCVFHIHNGKFYVVNDPIFLKINLKGYKNYTFKLGQFSYNKFIHTKGGFRFSMTLLLEDIKKKRGVSIKLKKSKKMIFVSKEDGSRSKS